MIEVLQPGFYSTIQDLGRFGYQCYGVPISGAMDQFSARLANDILCNSEEAAVLEITMTGPKLKFHLSTTICIAGAELTAMVNDKEIANLQTFTLKAGDILSFAKLRTGFRAYLAVAGGFLTKELMQSRSMYVDITSKFRIAKGDHLSICGKIVTHKNFNIQTTYNSEYLNRHALKVYEGPEFYLLSEEQKNTLFSSEFTVSKENSRMAYQLNQVIKNNLPSIITSIVIPGTVQLTPSGKLIILMLDCQTTGGYPRILQLADDAIHILSQKFTGSAIQFDWMKS
jgi:biotin-dependent carboxylase-like uncharacterized protein